MVHTISIAFTSKHLGEVLITTIPPCEEWIQDWMKQLLEPDDKLRVPAAASRITSPLILDNWRIMLAEYPNRPLADFFISEDFRVSFTPCGTRIKSEKRNPALCIRAP